jgi:hypothetical protein
LGTPPLVRNGNGVLRLPERRGGELVYATASSGGAGDDSIDARDGEKDGTIDCGSGRDTVRTDGREPTFDCEREVAEPIIVPTPGEVAP